MLLSRVSSAVFCAAAIAAPATAQDTTRVSVDSSGAQANGSSGWADKIATSADGRVVAFTSDATNLVPFDTNQNWDVFVHDRSTGVTERMSVDSSGTEGNGMSYAPTISADGNLVAFQSYATNLVTGDVNGFIDVFVHDRTTGVTERVSVDSAGVQGNDASFSATFSADGRSVAFFSSATNLVAGDTNKVIDVFVHDRATGLTERVSVDSSGNQGDHQSGPYPPGPAISADGMVVAFESQATNLVAGDTNGCGDVFVHDRSTGITERVSLRRHGGEANNESGTPSLSADGKIVAFLSFATNLVANDRNKIWDAYVRDRVAGDTERISVDSSGAEANGGSTQVSISADGRLVTFSSEASNLVAGDANGVSDAFVHDRATGVTERVTVDSSGAEANDVSFNTVITADGLAVAFTSYATNLVANDTNGGYDVFVHEFCSAAASWSNYGAGFPGTLGIPTFTSQQNPALGTTITLDLSNSYAQPTFGLIFVGFQRTSIHSGWGGDLLVVPALTMFVTFSYGGDSFTGTIPADRNLCGVAVDLQAIEADPGAARGVSFTAGLELVLGK